MKIDQLMNPAARSCAASDDLSVPSRIMWEEDCGCVPVVAADMRVVGMITDRDICMATYTQSRAPREIRVGDVMSREVHVCSSFHDARQALAVMKANQVRRLPVVDANRRLVGVVSLNDLACAAARLRGAPVQELALEDVALTLAGVSEHREHAEGRPGLPARELAVAGAGA